MVEVIAAADNTSSVDVLRPIAAVSSSKVDDSDRKSLAVELEQQRHLVAGTKCIRTVAHSKIAEKLIRHGLPETIANLVIGDGKSSPEQIKGRIARLIRCTKPFSLNDKQLRAVFIGPTGVGKTTTLAKLAAELSLNQGKKVAIISMDNQRVGAKDQMEKYAWIMNIPLETVVSLSEVEAALSAHIDSDVVLIDTDGISPRNQERIEELARFVDLARPTDVFLVLSATTDITAQLEAVSGFARFSPNKLIITKLDECAKLGVLVGLAVETLLPISCITYGQSVPGNIKIASADELAEAIWNGVWDYVV
jgi:flagellar biosynthesis protein FlhF